MKTFLQLARDLMKPGEEIAALLTADEADLWHGATGVAGEAGELLDAIKKHVVYKKPLDRENVVEELADLRFYMAALMNGLAITEVEITEAINRKLGKRYASGSYSNEQAQARADKRPQAIPPVFAYGDVVTVNNEEHGLVNSIMSYHASCVDGRHIVTDGETAFKIGPFDAVLTVEAMSPRHPDYGVATDEDDFAEAFDAKLAKMGEGLRTEAEMQAEDEARAAGDDV